MRIRYWSSDVCSSDLGTDGDLVLRRHVTLHRVVGMTDEIAVEHDAGFHRMCDDAIVGKASRQLACEQHIGELGARVRTAGREVARALQVLPIHARAIARSEGSRVGKAWVRKCRSRGWPDH